MDLLKLAFKVILAIIILALFCVCAFFGFKPTRIKAGISAIFNAGKNNEPQPTPEELIIIADEAETKAKEAKIDKELARGTTK